MRAYRIYRPEAPGELPGSRMVLSGINNVHTALRRMLAPGWDHTVYHAPPIGMPSLLSDLALDVDRNVVPRVFITVGLKYVENLYRLHQAPNCR